MPTWGEILNELNQSQVPQGTGPDFDGIRRWKSMGSYGRRVGDAACSYGRSGQPTSA